MARQWALEQVANTVQERVAQYAYPALYQQPTGNFVQKWDFDNLLGAMWLQMLWFLTSNDQQHCRQCNRPILRPRRTKMFCSDTCKERNYYLTVTKSWRQARRTD
jgi:hypothetical protein